MIINKQDTFCENVRDDVESFECKERELMLPETLYTNMYDPGGTASIVEVLEGNYSIRERKYLARSEDRHTVPSGKNRVFRVEFSYNKDETDFTIHCKGLDLEYYMPRTYLRGTMGIPQTWSLDNPTSLTNGPDFADGFSITFKNCVLLNPWNFLSLVTNDSSGLRLTVFPRIKFRKLSGAIVTYVNRQNLKAFGSAFDKRIEDIMK